MKTAAIQAAVGSARKIGVSAFLSAYLDSATGSIHLSRFADGRRAPIHLLDGLPEPLVLGRDTSGKVVALKGSVSAGFVREGRFYTREQAGRAMMREARWKFAFLRGALSFHVH